MKLSARNTLRKGFTLIELLVVIGILGILAAALIATIDPFEQLNKGTDARVENTVVETQNALLRYYTIRGVMPWDAAPQGDGCNSDTQPAGETLEDLSDCVDALINQGELRPAFANSADMDEIHVNINAVTNAVEICYSPRSKAKQNDLNTAYDETAQEVGAECPGGGYGTCYLCIK